jgi:phosphate transport system protein
VISTTYAVPTPRIREVGLDQVQGALEALKRKDLDLARRVVDRDSAVDAMEVRADDQIVSVIAQRAPVARDLRTLVALSKAVGDLERIGDEAARIASIILHIYDSETSDPSVHLLRDIQTMGKLAVDIFRGALEVLDRLDAPKAQEIARGDRELDAEFRSSLRRLVTFVMEDARNVGHAINVVLVIKALERVGDHSRNIAEYVVYPVKGTDIRHQSREEQASAVPGPAAGDSGTGEGSPT